MQMLKQKWLSKLEYTVCLQIKRQKNNSYGKFPRVHHPSQVQTPKVFQRDIKGDSSDSDARDSPDRQLRVSRKWKNPGNAMNRFKTNTYQKYYEVCDEKTTTSIISPKPWHPTLATQVDIVILNTYNKLKYCFQG